MQRNVTSPLRKFLAVLPAVGLRRLWQTWFDRNCTRHALRRLDPHMLRDIGCDPADARDEYTKYFWQD